MSELSSTRIALILSDDLTVRKWQFLALEECVRRGATIAAVAVCRNDRSRRSLRHSAYYALAAVTAKKLDANRSVSVTPLLLHSADLFEFESVWDGAWQRIPQHTLVRFEGTDVAVKFGMNLLRDPDHIPTRLGVLSYHHGDPEAYRGRPAGYYEISEGTSGQGVIVQRLSNTLDAGIVFASARIPVARHSYKTTLARAYAASVPLLWKAIENAQQDNGYLPSEHGTNFRLPANGRVLRDGLRIAQRKTRRLLYGAFQEKTWRVYRMERPSELKREVQLRVEGLESIPLPTGYTFAADPFVSREGALFCELLEGETGRGRIGVYKDENWNLIELPDTFGHVSYPFLVEDAGQLFLLPEVASHTSPTLLALSKDDTRVLSQIQIQGLENERLVDCTVHHQDGHWYLFGSPTRDSLFRLDLWVSESLAGPYRRHPDSPICMDATRARMAGPIVTVGTEKFRLGQNCTVTYGGSLTVSRIDTLQPAQYGETRVGGMSVSDASGPHTMTIQGEAAWIDAYRVKTTPMAGIRRIKALSH